MLCLWYAKHPALTSVEEHRQQEAHQQRLRKKWVQCTVYQLIAVTMTKNLNGDDANNNENNNNKKPTNWRGGKTLRHYRIRLKPVWGGIFDCFFRGSFRPEVVSDVISGSVAQDVGMDVCANFGNARLKLSEASLSGTTNDAIRCLAWNLQHCCL